MLLLSRVDQLGWGSEIPGRDGRTIFARGLTPRGELLRFNSGSDQFQPFLGGVSAEFLSFSGDGKTVAYVTFPDGILWRANRDGSGRVQLSNPPIHPAMAGLSPDGTRVLFEAITPQGGYPGFVVSWNGGTPRRLLPDDNGDQTDANWSPDGHKVVFFRDVPGDKLRILDLDSHQVTALPGSVDLYSPRWSPDGRSVAAMSLNNTTLKIFDLATKRWSTMFHGETEILGFPTWSHNSQFLYALYLKDHPGVYRVPVAGGAAQRIADLTGFHHTGWVGFWFGLDPTDAPLLLRDAGSDDIYALRLESK